MKNTTMIVIAAAIGLSGAAYAEEGKGPHKPHKLPPEVLEKFDKNKDGKLDEEEQKAARAARGEMEAKFKKEMLEKFDADGDGKLNDDEKEAMREGMKKKMLERFDKDNSGDLNEEEKAEMRKAMMHRPGGPEGGPRGGPEGGPKGGPKGGPRGDGDRPKKDGGGEEEAPGAGE